MKHACDPGRRVLRVIIISMLLFSVAGCERNERIYRIELRPKGDSIERRLTFSRPNRNFDSADQPELARIATAFGLTPPKVAGQEVSFVGAFANKLPTDVGGAGHYLHWESPLGRVVGYVERFRGSDDIFTQLEKRRKAVDQLADLAIGWFESELRGERGWPALRGFLDKECRNDLHNLSVYAFALSIRPIVDSKSLSAEMGFRMAEYFVERGYVTYEDGPVLARTFADANRENGAPLPARLRKFLVAHAGSAAGGISQQNLAFLSNPNRLTDSWKRYFERTNYFKSHQQEFRQRLEREQAAQQKSVASSANEHATKARQDTAALADESHRDGGEILGDLVANGFMPLFEIFPDSNQLNVSLVAPREPFWTNGKWVAENQRIVWSGSIPSLPDPAQPKWEWPTFCIAAWDEPNEDMQKRHLGLVGLTGTGLLNYCLWYQGLTSQEKAEWDAFVATIKNDQPSRERLQTFRFSNEPANRKLDERVAAPAAETLLKAFDAQKAPVKH